jgi:hypothetical protein
MTSHYDLPIKPFLNLNKLKIKNMFQVVRIGFLVSMFLITIGLQAVNWPDDYCSVGDYVNYNADCLNAIYQSIVMDNPEDLIAVDAMINGYDSEINQFLSTSWPVLLHKIKQTVDQWGGWMRTPAWNNLEFECHENYLKLLLNFREFYECIIQLMSVRKNLKDQLNHIAFDFQQVINLNDTNAKTKDNYYRNFSLCMENERGVRFRLDQVNRRMIIAVNELIRIHNILNTIYDGARMVQERLVILADEAPVPIPVVFEPVVVDPTEAHPPLFDSCNFVLSSSFLKS